MPQWEDLPSPIKVAWEVAVRHTAEVLDALPSPIANLDAMERHWENWTPPEP